MFILRKPSESQIRTLLESQHRSGFSYAEVGMTRGESSETYSRDRFRARLGRGRDVFERATSAIWHLKHLQLDWVETYPSELPVRSGTTVVLVSRLTGFYSVNVCRVVYAEDLDEGSIQKSCFAYGTLHEHVERGEERFCVEWEKDTGRVYYHIDALSRPNHLLVWLAYPLARRLQTRFREDSFQALRSNL